MSKDYYAILGVPRNASQDDIKKAFRKKAAELHPDRGGNEAAFKEVNTAYQVLTDEVMKMKYDAWGDENASGPPRRAARPPGAPHVQVTLDDLNSFFNQNFDPFGPFAGRGFGDFARKAKAPAPQPGGDVGITVTVSMEDALAGAKKNVRFDRGDTKPCTKCVNVPNSTCPTCGGSGRVMDMVAGRPAARQCRTCGGAGKTMSGHCGTCGGSRLEPLLREIDLHIPKGCRHGQNMKVKGLGKNGSPPGDLMVTVNIVDSDTWWSRGDALFTIAEVGMSEAIRGGNVTVNMPGGQPLLVFVPMGGGITKVAGAWKNPAGGDGDLYVIFRVRAQGGMTPRAERLMKELLEELGVRAR